MGKFGTVRSLGTGKFGTGKSLGTGIGNFLVSELIFVAKILESTSRRFIMGTGTVYVPVPGIFHFFWWYQNWYRKYLVPKKSISIGIVEHFGYRHTLQSREGCKKRPF